MKKWLRTLVACGIIPLLSVGCEGAAEKAPSELPVAPVSPPVSRLVTDYIDFTGRVDAVQAVDIRARVTGYLERMPFKEGALVKEDDVLFEIDSRPYRSQFEQAQKQVELNQATLKLARTTYERDRALASSLNGAVSRQQIDQDEAAVEEALARVRASESSRDVYRLNLDFCKVRSPISGQVGRYYLTKGNLVNQDQTLLTTIVSLDPIYVYFDVDEASLARLRAARQAHEQVAVGLASLQPGAGPLAALAPLSLEGASPVWMGLQGEDGFPHRGWVNFVNNQINPSTASLALRAWFANPVLPSGHRQFAPGMFIRVRAPVGAPRPSLLVIDRAVQSDQDLKFVYVVDAEQKAQYRRIKTGPLQDDGLRVVTDGLKPDDLVVVGGTQLIRPKQPVRVDRLPEMPTLRPTTTDEKPRGPGGKSHSR